MSLRVLIIIPAHNEAKSLPTLIPEIAKSGFDYLVVNDFSNDQTEEVLQKGNYQHLNLPNNIGLAGVSQMGFLYAYEQDYDAAIVIDGDGQHLPVYIPSLVKKLEEGYDYVVGSRYLEEKKPWNARMIGSRILVAMIHLKTGKRVTDPTSGMRALGRKCLKEFSDSMNFVAEPDALVYLVRHHYKTTEVPVEMMNREEGVSYFRNPLRSIQFMFNVIMSILFIQW